MDQKEKPHILLAIPALPHFQEATLEDVRQKVEESEGEAQLVILLGPGWVKEDFIQAVKPALATRVISNSQEWDSWTKRGDPVLHIELRKKASSLTVLPASLDIVAEFANGLASNLITSLLRAWDFESEKKMELVVDWKREFEEHPVSEMHLGAISKYSKQIKISRLKRQGELSE